MNRKTGVLLLNMGGPRRQQDVLPFLRNLFSDRQIIRLGPAFLQKPLAALIARRRAPKSMANYQKIGGGSPIAEITSRQAAALEQLLAAEGNFIVRPAMRYWHPFAAAALLELAGAGVTELVALPLYPQYSRATNGSSLYDLHEQNRKLGLHLPVREIRSWPTEPDYIACLAARIEEGLTRFNGSQAQVVYSAHSLPQKFIDEGDPYLDELRQTIAALEEQTGRQGRLCFQSRSGPMQWLEPSTEDTLIQLAAEGCKNILMVPIAFVSDHIETLYEIDMLYKGRAEELSMRLESTNGLNDEPQFIRALGNLVLATVSF